jgi:hypothetical protein
MEGRREMKYKFRGKRVDNDNWVYGYYLEWNDRSWIYPGGRYASFPIGPEGIEVHSDSVGQWTGLKDKDGVEIDWWEGDIFKHSAHGVKKDCCFYIVYKQGCFFAKGIGDFFYEPPVHHILWAGSDIKKIGNTTDNPELLEDKP